MSQRPPLSDDDLLVLSAYLDDQLSSAEKAELEQRLQIESALQVELDSLRQTTELLRGLPILKAPRDFTLDPAMVGSSSAVTQQPKITPLTRRPIIRRLGALSAMAAALMVFVFGAVFLLTGSSNDNAAMDESVLENAAGIPVTDMVDRAADTVPVITEVAQDHFNGGPRPRGGTHTLTPSPINETGLLSTQTAVALDAIGSIEITQESVDLNATSEFDAAKMSTSVAATAQVDSDDFDVLADPGAPSPEPAQGPAESEMDMAAAPMMPSATLRVIGNASSTPVIVVTGTEREPQFDEADEVLSDGAGDIGSTATSSPTPHLTQSPTPQATATPLSTSSLPAAGGGMPETENGTDGITFGDAPPSVDAAEEAFSDDAVDADAAESMPEASVAETTSTTDGSRVDDDDGVDFEVAEDDSSEIISGSSANTSDEFLLEQYTIIVERIQDIISEWLRLVR